MRLVPVCLRLIALLFTFTLAQAQAPEPRTALVIGNADYSYGPLKNPLHDAEAVAKALGEAGFRVTVKTDADQQDMKAAIRSFGKALKAKGGVGLFFYRPRGADQRRELSTCPSGTAERTLTTSGPAR